MGCAGFCWVLTPGAHQGVLYHNEELPQDVLDFLKLRCCQQDPKASSSL